MLVFEQSEAKSQLYSAIFTSLRSTVINRSATPVSLYVESLDLSRFGGPAYLESLRSHLRTKYHDKPRASDVIKRLRTFLARRAIQPQDVDVNQVARDVLDMASAPAAARNTTLVSKLDQSPLIVLADRVQLQQVLLNLVINSIQAMDTPSGGGEIDVAPNFHPVRSVVGRLVGPKRAG